MEMHILSDSMHQTEIDISYICHHQQLNSEKKRASKLVQYRGGFKRGFSCGKNITLLLNVTFGLLERPPGEIYDKSALVTQSVHFIQ